MDITAISAAAVMFILGATSPGPSLAVVLRNTMIGGRSRGLACAVGHGIGFGFYAVSVVFGLVVIMENNPDVFTLMQIIGGLFLLYLGIGMIRSEATVIVQSEGKREGFFEGFFIAFLNPKIAVFFLSLFSQFLSSEQSFIIHLGMATLAGVIDTVAYVLMVSLASTQIMLKFLSTYKTSVEFCFGLLLIALSISLSAKILIDYFS